MKIITKNPSFKARIIIMPQGTTKITKQNLSDSVKVVNKHKKQSILSKIMTFVVKPYLKSVLKNPS